MIKAIILIATLLLAQSLVVVHGMAELTPAMLAAENLEELLALEGQRQQQKEESRRLRQRSLQDSGIADSEPILAGMFGGEAGFYHGVASGTCHNRDIALIFMHVPVPVINSPSFRVLYLLGKINKTGDPLPNAVIVWTRYTPVLKDDAVILEFRMAKVDPDLEVEDHLDPANNPALHRAHVTVSAESDFVAKIDVMGLEAGQNYVYAFAGTICFIINNLLHVANPAGTLLQAHQIPSVPVFPL